MLSSAGEEESWGKERNDRVANGWMSREVRLKTLSCQLQALRKN